MSTGGGGDDAPGGNGSSPWKNIPSELVLKTLQYLPRADLLSARLVSKNFVPRQPRVAVWIFPHAKQLLVGLNLSTKRTEYERGAEFEFDHDPEPYNSFPGFLQHHEFGDGTDLEFYDFPDSLLEKARFLTVAMDESSHMDNDTQDGLDYLRDSSRNLVSICGLNADYDKFYWIEQILERNQGLNRICFVKTVKDKEAKGIDFLAKMEYFDCNWITDFDNLREITIMNYGVENLAKLPVNLNHLFLQSIVSLENIVWMSENQRELRNFGVSVHEEVTDKSLLRHMSRNGKPTNAFQLVGLHPEEGIHTMEIRYPILTPELVRRFIHLPHVENLLFDFILTMDPRQEKDEEFLTEKINRLEDRFHKLEEACKKTPGIMKAQFFGTSDPATGTFGYSITISIDQQTFNGLLP